MYISNRKKALILFLVNSLFLIWLTKGWAAGGDFAFDKNTTYDIYYYGGGNNISIIKDVEIVRIDVIHDTDFLVVVAGGFKVKNYEGYVLFSSIRAILPHSFYRVQNISDFTTQ